MFSESDRNLPEISTKTLLDLNQWQKIQNLFAEIIGTNLWLLDPKGNCLIHPSKVNTCCCDLISTSYASLQPTECVSKAYENWVKKKGTVYKCSHLLNFFVLALESEDQEIAYIVSGPIILGKREPDAVYRKIAHQNQIEVKEFLDWIREIKILSQHSFNLIINFLTEISNSFIKSKTQMNHMLATIFEAARQAVGADSGSVLIFHPEQNELIIHSSYGLKSEILKKEKLPNDGIASWVIARNEAVLINESGSRNIPQDQLKRPEIKSSMIVPIQKDNQVLGVICLNSSLANERFNENSVLMVRQLSRLVSNEVQLN